MLFESSRNHTIDITPLGVALEQIDVVLMCELEASLRALEETCDCRLLLLLLLIMSRFKTWLIGMHGLKFFNYMFIKACTQELRIAQG